MLPKGENTGDVRASGKVLCMGLRRGKCGGWAWREWKQLSECWCLPWGRGRAWRVEKDIVQWWLRQVEAVCVSLWDTDHPSTKVIRLSMLWKLRHGKKWAITRCTVVIPADTQLISLQMHGWYPCTCTVDTPGDAWLISLQMHDWYPCRCMVNIPA